MCFPQSTPVDHSAEIARQQEQARKERITTGQGKIDNAFGMFDPAYFDKYKTDFLNYYNPQVDKQFGLAKQDLRYNLARKGTMDSTPGQYEFGKLVDSYGQRRNEVASNANSAMAGQKATVESNKASLYQENTASADPSLAAQSAVSRVGALSTPPVYSPLADLFAGAVNGASAVRYGSYNAMPAGYAPFFSPGYYSSPGSGRVVN